MHEVRASFERSLKNLDSGYIDVYLMHWPFAKDASNKVTDLSYVEVYKEMEKLLEDGECWIDLLLFLSSYSTENDQAAAKLLVSQTSVSRPSPTSWDPESRSCRV